jgi:4-hydroxybenzoate polyprenyltransferase
VSKTFPFEFQPAEEVAPASIAAAYPLVLDLDGTLLRTDLLLETALQYIKPNPFRAFLLVLWLWRGVAHLKHQLALRTNIAPEHLPVNERLERYARAAQESGRPVVVATAANRELAAHVCARFGFVGEIIASCERVNLGGARKADALKNRFPGGFSYAGDAAADLEVWRIARFGLFAGQNSTIQSKASKLTVWEADFPTAGIPLRSWVRALRLHQWAKNGLIFLPLLLAGKILDVASWFACLSAFLSLGLVASGTYIINDLFDLQADRQHWSKRHRPIAAGVISIPRAATASALLISGGLFLAAFAGGLTVAGLIALYCLATLAYSLYLKQVPLLDATTLAMLFTLRLALGSAAADAPLSPWLAVFSMFLFLSLALAKRSTELNRNIASSADPAVICGRGYVACDAPLVASMGISAAVAAVLVDVLYLINEAFPGNLYGLPELLWLAPVLIGLWLARIWLLCGRGELNDDPVAFAVTDRISLALGAGVVLSFAGAAVLG